MRLVRSGDGPIFRSSAPEWLEKLLLRGKLVRTSKTVIGREDEACITFADRLRDAGLTGRLRSTWTHIPHEVGGGAKNAVLRYSKAKAMGLVTGSGDYVFLWQGGGCWMEFKAPATGKEGFGAKRAAGRMTEMQKLFQQWCAMLGVPHHVVTSSYDGLALLQGYGVYDPD